jgi:hypothetical protein
MPRCDFRKGAKAFLTAVALVAAMNAWVALRLPALLLESSLGVVVDLERRVAAYPNRQDVQVLIFGNSHAITGLRPPLIAEALGLPPGAVFNLALPSGSPLEMGLLAERFLPAFPRARQAICVVDEFFLAEQVDTRVRYLTRLDPRARWRYAGRAGSIDDRLALLMGGASPIFDFAVPLREALLQRPALTLQRLLWDRPPAPGTESADLMALSYPWGSPPIMDGWAVPDPTLPKFLRTRGYLLMKNARQIPQGLSDLEAMTRLLEERGLDVTLVGLPYTRPQLATLQREFPEYARYRRQLAGYLTATGRVRREPEGVWGPTSFTDADHISPLGARRVARWLKESGHRGSD